MDRSEIKNIAWSIAREESPISYIDELLKQLTNEERLFFSQTFKEAMEVQRAERRREHEKEMRKLEEVDKFIAESRKFIAEYDKRREKRKREQALFLFPLGEA